MPRRTPPTLRALPVAALLLFTVGCSGGDDKGETEAPLPTLREVLATDPAVNPTSFCDRIDERVFATTIGEVAGSTSYGNGERATVAPGVEDVAHEVDCTFTGAEGIVARAWVFVPPVTPERAKKLVTSASGTRGCKTTPGREFGTPGLHTLCADGNAVTATLQGLFTDTWFSCSLSVPDLEATRLDSTDVTVRADAWCAAALSAASATS
ncbi:hypothetical protein ACLM5J_09605 [Nocardioides sp. Bht2]|uniref:hypothetical protein n=1 Tax=Nocardioides sp. Bht2 TaxID=3392297 RepID=UPI0039B61E5E